MHMEFVEENEAKNVPDEDRDLEQGQEARDLVKETRDLLGAAAPAPWFWKLSYEMPSGRKHWALTNAEEHKQGRIIDASLILQLTRPTWFDRECPTMPNWELIARAPELLSALCDEVERLRRVIDKRAAAIRAAKQQ